MHNAQLTAQGKTLAKHQSSDHRFKKKKEKRKKEKKESLEASFWKGIPLHGGWDLG